MYPKEITTHYPDSNKPTTGGGGGRARRVLAAVLLLLVTNSVPAAGFVINHAEIVLSDKVYQLNARLSFDFSKDVMSAIDNGVPIVLNVVWCSGGLLAMPGERRASRLR